MSKTIESVPQSDELLLNFFSSYLKDISVIISEIKHNMYKLINVNPPPSRNISVSNDIRSIMAACNLVFDDAKRSNGILKGYLKGQGIDEERSNRSSRSGEKNSNTSSIINDTKFKLSQKGEKSTPVNDFSKTVTDQLRF